jgi:hypothetical protein
MSLLLAGAAAALAQPKAIAPTGQPRPPEIPVQSLTVSPAPAPEPALRYRLLPELRDTTPGNAVVLYYRAFAPEWWQNVRGNKELREKVEKAVDLPAAEIKSIPEVAFVRDWAPLKEVDRAARRSYCDWEMTQRVREEGIYLLLPDVQSMREHIRFLAIRAKLELADRQFDKAAHTYQTGLQMGRHVGDAPTLIQALVGAAITAVTLKQVEDWVGTPDSPNLYWALTDLPQPFIDLRKPLQGERMLIDSVLPGYREALADPAKTPPPVTPEDLNRKLDWSNESGLGAKLGVTFLVAKRYPAAKAYLRAHGRTAEQVEALPALEAVLLNEVATYDRLFEEMQKSFGLPYWEARPALEKADQDLKNELVRSGGPGLSLAGMLLPAISKVRVAGARTDRQINALRCVEAIRLYAAAHGKLPASLADVTEVPIPTDPMTGKPFEYHVADGQATLAGPPPGHEPPHAGNSLRYEITLRR